MAEEKSLVYVRVHTYTHCFDWLQQRPYGSYQVKISLETIKQKKCSLFGPTVQNTVPNNGEPFFRQCIVIIFFPLPHLLPNPRYLFNLVFLSFSLPLSNIKNQTKQESNKEIKQEVHKSHGVHFVLANDSWHGPCPGVLMHPGTSIFPFPAGMNCTYFNQETEAYVVCPHTVHTKCLYTKTRAL